MNFKALAFGLLAFFFVVVAHTAWLMYDASKHASGTVGIDVWNLTKGNPVFWALAIGAVGIAYYVGSR